MPLFFFHLRSPAGLEPDTRGTPFGSLEAATLDAWQAACAIWGELLAERKDPRGYAFEITATDGRLLTELPFAEVLDTVARQPPEPPPDWAVVRQSLLETRAQTRIVYSQVALAREAVLHSRDVLAASRGGRTR